LGLRRPARGILTDWAVSKDLVLALFPDWFAPPQPDWPTPTRVTRFPLYDEAGARSADPGLEAFLQSGDPPILLTPGSANQQARRFFTVGLEACWKLGKRALLVTPFREQLPASLPSGAAHFSFVPFGHVFSRCAAVLHHGGIGTCAQGMAAGVPQFLMPMGFDQPDNAWRLRRLGVGDYLYPAKFEPDAVARRLGLLLESEIVARACRDVAEKMRTQMPPADVARILEQFPVQAGK
jgi:UDP:flavonoid glycosyltransferase YjiC (YdhE family)